MCFQGSKCKYYRCFDFIKRMNIYDAKLIVYMSSCQLQTLTTVAHQASTLAALIKTKYLMTGGKSLRLGNRHMLRKWYWSVHLAHNWNVILYCWNMKGVRNSCPTGITIYIRMKSFLCIVRLEGITLYYCIFLFNPCIYPNMLHVRLLLPLPTFFFFFSQGHILLLFIMHLSNCVPQRTKVTLSTLI